MWKIKKITWPKKISTLPVAKVNQVNRLVSSQRDIKLALYHEYKERLRRRKVRPDFVVQKQMDERLIKLKVNEARQNKSESFNLNELEML